MQNRKPNRLKYFDYSQAGWYFVTICTKDHKHFFGNIFKEKIVLNEIGKIANECWEEIPKHFPNVELEEFVVMPNHIHGIIIINSVGDANFASPTDRTKMGLCKLIQQFKRAVSIQLTHKLNIYDFKWQRSFYDRIIRNETELYNIRKYIQQNPLKWSLKKDIVNLDI